MVQKSNWKGNSWELFRSLWKMRMKKQNYSKYTSFVDRKTTILRNNFKCVGKSFENKMTSLNSSWIQILK